MFGLVLKRPPCVLLIKLSCTKWLWPHCARYFQKKKTSKGYVSLDRLICFFAYFVLFGSWKKKVVDFYLPNSRFHWLFQEPAQDLTLFNFLKENCYIGWMTYKSTADTESNKYFYISVSKNVRRQENYCYQWLQFLTQFDKNSFSWLVNWVNYWAVDKMV